MSDKIKRNFLVKKEHIEKMKRVEEIFNLKPSFQLEQALDNYYDNFEKIVKLKINNINKN